VKLDQTVRELLPVMQARLLGGTTYAGVQAVKSPLDAWMYQEIVWQRKPQTIVEIGNWRGGSLLMYAHWLDAIGSGRVIGVDVDHSRVPQDVWQHPRVELVTGDAVKVAAQVADMIQDSQVFALEPQVPEVLIIEDSSHEAAQTLGVLRAYEGLVRPGGYFIVEDTICWHGLDTGPRPGPFEAVEMFLVEQGARWVRDPGCESFGVTWNPGGYLRRRGNG